MRLKMIKQDENYGKKWTHIDPFNFSPNLGRNPNPQSKRPVSYYLVEIKPSIQQLQKP